MDNQQEQKKSINLMPEDMRSKESGILSKTKAKSELDFDFVSPDSSALKKVKEKSSVSFFDKLKKIFKKPAGFSEPIVRPDKDKTDKKTDKTHQPTHSTKDTKKEEFSLHMPDKEDKRKYRFSVDYKDGIYEKKVPTPKDIFVKDKSASEPNFHLSDQDEKNKKFDWSFWGRLKNWFKFAHKNPKEPVIERVPARPIVPKELVDTAKPTEDTTDLIDILDEKNIKSIPELKISSDNVVMEKPAESTKSLETEPIMAPAPDKQDSGFSIPSLNIKEESYQPQTTDKIESSAPKYHEPAARIRAKFLNDGGGVDLIPEAVKVRSWRQILRLLAITFISFSMVIVIFYAFLFYQAKKLETKRNENYAQITSLERKIVDYKKLNDDITRLGNQIKTTHKLISLHIYWTNFFQLLEKYTIEGVYYLGLKAGTNGAMTLEASVSDYDTLAKQIKILQQEEAKEFVTYVDVPGATFNEKTKKIDFSMHIILNPSLFLYNPNYIYEERNQ